MAKAILKLNICKQIAFIALLLALSHASSAQKSIIKYTLGFGIGYPMPYGYFPNFLSENYHGIVEASIKIDKPVNKNFLAGVGMNYRIFKSHQAHAHFKELQLILLPNVTFKKFSFGLCVEAGIAFINLSSWMGTSVSEFGFFEQFGFVVRYRKGLNLSYEFSITTSIYQIPYHENAPNIGYNDEAYLLNLTVGLIFHKLRHQR